MSPFRLPLALSPDWLAVEGAAVREQAAAIYEAGAFDRLPQLAEALEAAGCRDAHLLAHCREPGEHVRGCWALDCLLARE